MSQVLRVAVMMGGGTSEHEISLLKPFKCVNLITAMVFAIVKRLIGTLY